MREWNAPQRVFEEVRDSHDPERAPRRLQELVDCRTWIAVGQHDEIRLLRVDDVGELGETAEQRRHRAEIIGLVTDHADDLEREAVAVLCLFRQASSQVTRPEDEHLLPSRESLVNQQLPAGREGEDQPGELNERLAREPHRRQPHGECGDEEKA